MVSTEAGKAAVGCVPFLRWAGSKRRLVPLLRTFWTSKHSRYLEPFAGSACLFFAIEPPKAILGDLNSELISTYLQIKYRVQEVLRDLKKLVPASKLEYQRLRVQELAHLSPTARAARFIYLNRFCFNGIYRTNLAGGFNVPYSGDRCGRLPGEEAFRACSRLLRRVRFVTGDFEKVLVEARRGDLVYMDPPFAVRAKRIFREYHPDTFTFPDIDRLRSWMKRLDEKRISFVVSYAESEEADTLRKGFSYQTLAVHRHIAGFASHRRASNELVISNM
jgi:DNA adenine methylase